MIAVKGPYDIAPELAPPRHVRAYVPRGVAPHDRPLLLLFDGQNVFDDAPSYAGGWHAHVEVERLGKTAARPVLVGVDHGGEQRIAELSPFSFGPHTAKLDRLLDWIERHLLPDLRGEHRLAADPRRTIVAGSSMGGIASLYAALSRPHVFGGCIAMSPSLFIGRGAIFRWVERHGVPGGARIYLDAGAREAGGRLLESSSRLAELLARHGSAEVRYRADPNGEHNERSWRRRLLPALRFHFAGPAARGRRPRS